MKPLISSLELARELAAIEAEAMGWQPLGDGAYLHAGAPEEEELVVQVVGIPDAQLTGFNVLLLQ